eukprot:g18058.t1
MQLQKDEEAGRGSTTGTGTAGEGKPPGRFSRTEIDWDDPELVKGPSDDPIADLWTPKELTLSVCGVTFLRNYETEKLEVYASGLDRLPYEPFPMTAVGDDFHDAAFVERVAKKIPKRLEGMLGIVEGAGPKLIVRTGQQTGAAETDSSNTGPGVPAVSIVKTSESVITTFAGDPKRIPGNPAPAVPNGNAASPPAAEPGSSAGTDSIKLKYLDYVQWAADDTWYAHILRLNYAMLNGRDPKIPRKFFFSNICTGVTAPADFQHLIAGELIGGRYGVPWHAEELEANKEDGWGSDSPAVAEGAKPANDMMIPRINADNGAPALAPQPPPPAPAPAPETSKAEEAGQQFLPLPTKATADYTNYYSPIRLVDTAVEDVPWNCGDLLPIVLLENDVVRVTTYKKGVPSFPEVAVSTAYLSPKHSDEAKEAFDKIFEKLTVQRGPSTLPQLAEERRYRIASSSGVLSRDTYHMHLPLIAFLWDVLVAVVWLVSFLVAAVTFFAGEEYYKAKYTYQPTRAEYDDLTGRKLPPGSDHNAILNHVLAEPRRGVSPVLMYYTYDVKKPSAYTLTTHGLSLLIHVMSMFLVGTNVRTRLLVSANTSLEPRHYDSFDEWLFVRVLITTFYFSTFNCGFGIVKDVLVKNKRTFFHAYYLAFLAFFVTGSVVYLFERRNGAISEGDTMRFTSWSMSLVYSSRLFQGQMGMVKEYTLESQVFLVLVMMLAAPAILGVFAGLLTDALIAELDATMVEERAAHFFEHKELVRSVARKWRMNARRMAQRRERAEETGTEVVGYNPRADRIKASRLSAAAEVSPDYAEGGDTLLRRTWLPGKLSLLLHIGACLTAMVAGCPHYGVTVLTSGPLGKEDTKGKTSTDDDKLKQAMAGYPRVSREEEYMRMAADGSVNHETVERDSTTEVDKRNDAPAKPTETDKDKEEQPADGGKKAGSSPAPAAPASPAPAATTKPESKSLSFLQETETESESGGPVADKVLHLPHGDVAKIEVNVGPNGVEDQPPPPAAAAPPPAAAPAEDKKPPDPLADTLEKPKHIVPDHRVLESEEKPNVRVPRSLSGLEERWVADPDGTQSPTINFRSLYMQGWLPFLFYDILLPLNIFFLLETVFCSYVDTLSGRSVLTNFWRWLNAFLVTIFFLYGRTSCLLSEYKELGKELKANDCYNGEVLAEDAELKEKNSEAEQLAHLYAAPGKSAEPTGADNGSAAAAGAPTTIVIANDRTDGVNVIAAPPATVEGALTDEEKKPDGPKLPADLAELYKSLDEVAKERFGLDPERPHYATNDDPSPLDPYDPKKGKISRDKFTKTEVNAIHLQEYVIAFQFLHGLFIIQHLMGPDVRRILGRLTMKMKQTAWAVFCVFLLFSVLFGELFYFTERYQKPDWKYGKKGGSTSSDDGENSKSSAASSFLAEELAEEKAYPPYQQPRQQVFLSDSVNSVYGNTPNGSYYSSFGAGVFNSFNLLLGNWSNDDESQYGRLVTTVLLFVGVGIGQLPVAVLMNAVLSAIAAETNFLAGGKKSVDEAVEADEKEIRGRQKKLQDLVAQVRENGGKVTTNRNSTSSMTHHFHYNRVR